MSYFIVTGNEREVTMKKNLILFLCSFVLIFGLIGCGEDEVKHFDSNGSKSSKSVESNESKETADKSIVVYVCGEVVSPGVYEFGSGSRVRDAIAKAGGLTSEADSTAINQAAVLKDQDKIVVPGFNQSGDGGSGGNNKLININTATKEQLTTLPGIGEAKAESIISYRETKGGFKSLEDLMKNEGIKSSVYNKVKDKITVN